MTEVPCTCAALGRPPHTITCMVIAAEQPHAMRDPDGSVFYPDSPEDAEEFRRDWDAKPINPEAFAGWLTECESRL